MACSCKSNTTPNRQPSQMKDVLKMPNPSNTTSVAAPKPEKRRIIRRHI